MKQLRPYQAEGKAQIFGAWVDHDILMLALATGGGKTVLFVEVIKHLLQEGKRVMLVVHREEPILQAWQTLYSAHIYAGVIMAGYPEKFELPVQVCSIQTIQNRQTLPKADVLIIDEAHHVQADNSYGKIIARYIDAKALLVTATPYRLSGDGFKRLHPWKETKLLINRTLSQLQDEGYLVPLKYFAASVPDLAAVRLKKGDYVEGEARKAMELAPLVQSYREHAGGKQCVCFAINREHSKSIVTQYENAGIKAAHVDGTTPDTERRAIFSAFKAGRLQVIVNVGIITEGTDFPQMEAVQLAAPTKSLSKFLQMVGRATRTLSGLIDKLETAEQRKAAIAGSAKPFGIVLDNAGCWTDHFLPDYPHDWQQHFEGRKRAKAAPADELEILVFVAEDETGRRITTRKVEEVEGLQLVEIRTEHRQQVLNIVSLKEFDRLYAIFKNKKINKLGYVTFSSYLKYCKRMRMHITDEAWEYIFRRLYHDIEEKKEALRTGHTERKKTGEEVSDFTEQFYKIENEGVALSFLKRERTKYENENLSGVLQDRFR